jgi:hypothetical protein
VNQSTREALLGALGGFPFALRTNIEKELQRLGTVLFLAEFQSIEDEDSGDAKVAESLQFLLDMSLPLSALKGAVVGIDAAHYINQHLVNQSTREALIKRTD